MAPADSRFTMVVGCNRTTATGVALKDGDFEYEYSLQGDGTVPMELARLAGARHFYVECGHSDLPLADKCIAGTLDLLTTGATQRFAASPPLRRGSLTRVRDTELREQYPGQGRLAAHDAGTAPAVPRHTQRTPQGPRASPAAAACGATAADPGAGGRRRQCARRGHGRGRVARRSGQRRRGRHRCAAGGVIADWLQHAVVSGDAGNVTPIPRRYSARRSEGRACSARRGKCVAAPGEIRAKVPGTCARAPPIYWSGSAGSIA